MNVKLTMMAVVIGAVSVAAHATTVMPTKVKTQASYEDIADAAVWVSPINAAKDLLIASLEGDGLAVFDQSGRLLLTDSSKEILGADIRYGLKDGGSSMDVLAVGLPDEEAFAFYRIDPMATPILQQVGRIDTFIAPEAVCLYQNVTTGETTVTGLSDEGDVVQYKIRHRNGQIESAVVDKKGEPIAVRHAQVGGKLSACVADDETGSLYVAEQDVGIWVYGADAENVKDRRLMDVVAPLGHLEEIESMDMVYQANGKGYLLIADEGAGFLVYDREGEQSFKAKFDVTGVEEAKILAASPNGLWIGNTEIEEPVYERMALSSLTNQLRGVAFNDLQSHRHLSLEGVKLVKASGETEEVSKSGDAADDPAFWLNPEDASKSLIIATNKKGGLMAYDLKGKEVQFLKEGEPNNVDIRTMTDWDGSQMALATATNRDLNTLALYKIVGGDEPIQPVKAVGKRVHEEAPELVSDVDEVYGLCMYQAKNGQVYSFLNGKNGVIEQWRLTPTKAGIKGDIVRRLKVDSQPEGCVADDDAGILYVGEEDVAIWTFEADEKASTEAHLFAAVDGKQLVDDIEGLTLYQNGKDNYLIASSQGNNTYAVYDLDNDNRYLASFAIIGDDEKGIDGSSDTDGIHAVSINLGDAYPNGLFLAQDWYNLDAEYNAEKQNFKIVDWRNIERILQP
ncbi:phytase [Marinomonas posidonica]|uniref:3-phytase n=1 Tax=Marinomonas posidonica (strain CECT 7376 / NCIMB 14433 / IVIA-Po-181) TaxID=491952 RepID=F6CVU0_MARPP|nr:phytase [Marinomonas posidonica]AEF53148.1 3-phytase [Marinomonas posidonica IVIA-Po-181]